MRDQDRRQRAAAIAALGAAALSLVALVLVCMLPFPPSPAPSLAGIVEATVGAFRYVLEFDARGTAGLTPWPTDTPTATLTPTPQPTPTPEVWTATPTPDYVLVAQPCYLRTDRSGNTNVRSAPGGTVVTQLPPNTLFAALGYRRDTGGNLWVRRLLGGYVARWVVIYHSGCEGSVIADGP